MWPCASCGEYYHNSCCSACTCTRPHEAAFTFHDLFAGSSQVLFQMHKLHEASWCRPFCCTLACETQPLLHQFVVAMHARMHHATPINHLSNMNLMFHASTPANADLACAGWPCQLYSAENTTSTVETTRRDTATMHQLVHTLQQCLTRRLWNVLLIECVMLFYKHSHWSQIVAHAKHHGYTVVGPLCVSSLGLGECQRRCRGFAWIHTTAPAQPLRLVLRAVLTHMQQPTPQLPLLSGEEHSLLGLSPNLLQSGYCLVPGSTQEANLMASLRGINMSLREAKKVWPPLFVDVSTHGAGRQPPKPAPCCPTLKASQGKSVLVLHHSTYRFLTPYEHMRAMGFEWPALVAAYRSGLTDEQIRHLAGNAITALTAQCVLHTTFQAFPHMFLHPP
jgi:site-specific DNA-cytosine methylase